MRKIFDLVSWPFRILLSWITWPFIALGKKAASWAKADPKGLLSIVALLIIYGIVMAALDHFDIVQTVNGGIQQNKNVAFLSLVNWARLGGGLALSFIAGVFATRLNQTENIKSVHEIISRFVRLGILNVITPAPVDNSPNALELVKSANQNIWIMRTLVDNKNQLPYHELEIALTRGCNIDIILPCRGNTFIEYRKQLIPPTGGAPTTPTQSVKKQFEGIIETLENIYSNCKSAPKNGTLRLALYSGPFAINVSGNEQEWKIAILWEHLVATKSPQISLLVDSDLGRCAAKHFAATWEAAKCNGEIFELDQAAAGYKPFVG